MQCFLLELPLLLTSATIVR